MRVVSLEFALRRGLQADVLRVRSAAALHRVLFDGPRVIAEWRAEARRSVLVICATNECCCVSVSSAASQRIVLGPVCRVMRLRFFEAWNATVGGAYATLAYTHRAVTVRRPPSWAATARQFAQKQLAVARAAGDGELQFKCCVWLAYAEAYEWRFERARRWLRALARLLTRNDVQQLVGGERVPMLRHMVRHAVRYADAEQRRVDQGNGRKSNDDGDGEEEGAAKR
jgi:hypothetical protein